MFQTQESSVLLNKHQAMGMEEKKNVYQIELSSWLFSLIQLFVWLLNLSSWLASHTLKIEPTCQEC